MGVVLVAGNFMILEKIMKYIFIHEKKKYF